MRRMVVKDIAQPVKTTMTTSVGQSPLGTRGTGRDGLLQRRAAEESQKPHAIMLPVAVVVAASITTTAFAAATAAAAASTAAARPIIRAASVCRASKHGWETCSRHAHKRPLLLHVL